LGVGADLHQCDVGEPCRLELADPGEVPPEVGPARHLCGHVLLPHCPDAISNDAGTGSSALTLQPPVNQRNCSIARRTAACSSGS
jgi:hypothetical protein